MSCFNGQNRTLACYTLLCLVTILSAAYAAAQQSVFVHLNLSLSLFFYLTYRCILHPNNGFTPADQII
jgi:hypothetical protein